MKENIEIQSNATILEKEKEKNMILMVRVWYIMDIIGMGKDRDKEKHIRIERRYMMECGSGDIDWIV